MYINILVIHVGQNIYVGYLLWTLCLSLVVMSDFNASSENFLSSPMLVILQL